MATSHVSRDQLSVEQTGDYQARRAELPDGYTVSFELMPAGTGGPELYKGLPEDACQTPHWGYLFKGRFKATYTDGSEDVVSGGEAYYLRAGHIYEVLEDCESVEFSPTGEWRQTVEQMTKNVEAMEAGG